ncbi:hypothetical protein SAMN04488097_3334 [Epilithonimonas lactis]|nr:hypothetical protein SAMN04488097_3334 [Epilithonimonas lactis]
MLMLNKKINEKFAKIFFKLIENIFKARKEADAQQRKTIMVQLINI